MGTLTGVTRCWALDPSAAIRRLLARDGALIRLRG